ncbi:MAG: metalloregulator ArsR/SmtB family transcription factor [Archangium sp.]|nr:metalloregulator ArsR/SmtB family transcription factor [Archangium sp.]
MKRALNPDIRLLQAAADPTRLSILRRLSGEASVCACEFTACCDVAQPTVSHHLRVLREAGWVTSERRGSWVYYRLSPDAVARFGVLAGGLAGASSPVGATPAALTAGASVDGPYPLPVIQPRTLR